VQPIPKSVVHLQNTQSTMPLSPSIDLTIPHFQQEEDYSCVAACLRMALKYYDIDEQEVDLRLLLDTQFPQGTRFENVARAVGVWDLNLRLLASELPQLIETLAKNEVAILFLQTGPLDYWGGVNENHAVLVSGVDSEANEVYLNDPSFAQGPQTTSISTFEQAWNSTGNLTAFIFKP